MCFIGLRWIFAKAGSYVISVRRVSRPCHVFCFCFMDGPCSLPSQRPRLGTIHGTSSGHLNSLRASAPRELSLHLASSTARWPCTALCHRAHGPHQPRAGTTRPYQVARLHPQARPQGSTPPSVAPHHPPPRPRVITFEPSSSQQTSPPSASPLDCRGLPPASPLPAPSTRPSQRLSPEQDPRTALLPPPWRPTWLRSNNVPPSQAKMALPKRIVKETERLMAEPYASCSFPPAWSASLVVRRPRHQVVRLTSFASRRQCPWDQRRPSRR